MIKQTQSDLHAPIRPGIRERAAQIVLLVRAFEETDREGRVLPAYSRVAATRRAMMVTGLSDWQGELSSAANIRNGETVMRRARLLFDLLGRRLPVLHRVLHVARLGAGTTPALIVAAALVGLLGGLTGPRERIDLLAWPLLVMLAWNLTQYLWMTLCFLFRRRGMDGCLDQTAPRPWMRGGLSDRLAGLFLKGALWRRLHGRKIAQGGSERIRRITAKAIVRFGAVWHRLARPMLAARVHRTLHIGAAALAAGIVAGMTLRALVFAYPVTWFGDWLDARQIGWLLRVMLGPATALLGRSLPETAALQAPGPGGPAAPWLELYALTVLIYVVLPRLVLATVEARRSKRLGAYLPIDLNDSYFRRMFTAWRGATRRVQVLPYGFRPKLSSVASLKNLLYDSFGARAEIQMSDPLPRDCVDARLGGETTEPDSGPLLFDPERKRDRESYVVTLFNLVQPYDAPELATFLERTKSRILTMHGRLVVLVDVSGYRQRAGSAKDWMERLRSWKAAVGESGLTAVELDLDQPAVDRTMAAVREGLWPPLVTEDVE